MMEGALSLMQMAKICGALARLDRARLPYISVLTDPTTGGVTASFAMLGDLNIAEPKALIGFAGPRVIEQTIRQKLPEGFQRSEFLLEKGMLDLVVDRREMKAVIANALRFMGAAPLPNAAPNRRRHAGSCPSRRHQLARKSGPPSRTCSASNSSGSSSASTTSRAARRRLGHPERAFRSVHIAGTNGKGSVTAMVDAALRARRPPLGALHLAASRRSRRALRHRRHARSTQRRCAAAVGDVRDGDRAAARGRRARGAADVLRSDDRGRRSSCSAGRGVEVAVLEVGLGGRLDATNVVSARSLTAITSIAFDHQQYLGSTLREIAREKAGIIKPGVPVVVGDVGPEAWDVIERVARERGAELIRAGDGVDIARLTPGAAGDNVFRLRTPARDYGTVTLALRGAHQVANAVVAVRLLETLDACGVAVPPAAVVDGLAQVSWPGRLERRRCRGGRELLLDAAHNPAGAAALASYLTSAGGAPLVARVRGDARQGRARNVRARCCRPSSAADRHARAEPALGRSGRAGRRGARDRAGLAVDVVAVAASRRSTPRGAMSPRIVVAGSIFLLGDVMKEIGGRDTLRTTRASLMESFRDSPGSLSILSSLARC